MLFLIDNLQGGGAEKAIKIVAEGLAPDATLLLLEERRSYTLDPSVPCEALLDSLTLPKVPLAFLRLGRFLRQKRPPAVVATNTKSQLLLLLTLPFVRTKRLLNIQVNLNVQYQDRPYWLPLLRLFFKGADGYLCISEGIAASIREHFPPRPVTVIPNPIDFHEINNCVTAPLTPEEHALFGPDTLITIGRLTRQKGQEDLLRAMTYLPEPVNLVILGVGEREKELKALARSLEIEKRVNFLGFKANPFPYLRHARLFALSSHWEGFGNVIVEAMACDLPVVVSDCPSGPREILAPGSDPAAHLSKEAPIEKGEFGILVPTNAPAQLAEGIAYLLDNPEAYRHYRAQAAIRARNYESTQIAIHYQKAIDAVTVS